MRTSAILTLLLGSVSGCTPEAAAPAAPAPASVAAASAPAAAGAPQAATPASPGATRRVGAPVSIEYVPGQQAGSGTIRVRFGTVAQDVAIRAWGADGLAVAGDGRLLSGGSFNGRDVHDEPVTFTPGPGGSLLAVSVEGSFLGRRLARVQSFSFGSGPAPTRPGAGTLKRDADGKPIIVLPATSR